MAPMRNYECVETSKNPEGLSKEIESLTKKIENMKETKNFRSEKYNNQN